MCKRKQSNLNLQQTDGRRQHCVVASQESETVADMFDKVWHLPYISLDNSVKTLASCCEIKSLGGYLETPVCNLLPLSI